MPLAIWLPEKTGIPILGLVFGLKWTPHILSWGGAMYDLSIPFLLLFRRTRSMAYLGVTLPGNYSVGYRGSPFGKMKDLVFNWQLVRGDWTPIGLLISIPGKTDMTSARML